MRVLDVARVRAEAAKKYRDERQLEGSPAGGEDARALLKALDAIERSVEISLLGDRGERLDHAGRKERRVGRGRERRSTLGGHARQGLRDQRQQALAVQSTTQRTA
jgi:hypothetical protein